MKNSIFILLLFVANISFSQIYVEQSSDGSVTISPRGITSAGSNASGTGTTNVAHGRDALKSNISGISNVALGGEALKSNTTGNQNIGIGFRSLDNNNGSNNVAIGSLTAYKNSTGNNNFFAGYGSGFDNTTGSQNIAVGYSALSANVSNNYTIAIGYNSMLYADNGTSGSTTHNVALGHFALHGSTVAADNTGIENTSIGSYSLYQNTSGTGNTIVGFGAGDNNSTGNNNVFVGRAAGDNNSIGSNNIIIGYNADAPLGIGSNQVRIGNSSIAYAGVQVAWTITSDARLKENIKTLPYGLDFIKNLRPVSYTRKNDENQKLEFGVIAQEFESVLAKFDVKNAGFLSKDDKGFYSVRYNDLIAPLIKAVQEQQQIIEIQTQKTAQLEAKLLAFEAKLASLVASKDNNSPQLSDK